MKSNYVKNKNSKNLNLGTETLKNYNIQILKNKELLKKLNSSLKIEPQITLTQKLHRTKNNSTVLNSHNNNRIIYSNPNFYYNKTLENQFYIPIDNLKNLNKNDTNINQHSNLSSNKSNNYCSNTNNLYNYLDNAYSNNYSRNCEDYSNEDILDFIFNSLKIDSSYMRKIKENKIEFEDLLLLSKDDLKEMEFPIGPRNRILNFLLGFSSFLKQNNIQIYDYNNKFSLLQKYFSSQSKNKYLEYQFSDNIYSDPNRNNNKLDINLTEYNSAYDQASSYSSNNKRSRSKIKNNYKDNLHYLTNINTKDYLESKKVFINLNKGLNNNKNKNSNKKITSNSSNYNNNTNNNNNVISSASSTSNTESTLGNKLKNFELKKKNLSNKLNKYNKEISNKQKVKFI